MAACQEARASGSTRVRSVRIHASNHESEFSRSQPAGWLEFLYPARITISIRILLEILNCFGMRVSNSLDASLCLLECNCNVVWLWDFGLLSFAIVWDFLRVQLKRAKWQGQTRTARAVTCDVTSPAHRSVRDTFVLILTT